MMPDLHDRADTLLDAEAARRPRWWRLARRTPAWFSGGELDRLEPAERDDLYQRLQPRQQVTDWTLIVIAVVNVWDTARDAHAGAVPPLTLALTGLLVLAAVSTSFLRRRGIVRAGRRHVREQPDWPLRHAAAAPPSGR